MYHITVLTDDRKTGRSMVSWVRQFYEEQGSFPVVGLYEDTEEFWSSLKELPPWGIILWLPGEEGLKASAHLRSLLPDCGLIWCSDRDFALQAYRMRVEYFMKAPITHEKLGEGLAIWRRRREGFGQEKRWRR